MGFIACVKVKCITIMAQRIGSGKWKYTIVMFLHYMCSVKILTHTSLCDKLRIIYCNT